MAHFTLAYWPSMRPHSAQERRRTASIAARACATASPSSASAAAGSTPLCDGRLQPGGGIGDGKRADRPGRTFERMRQRAGIRRHVRRAVPIKAGGLGREHRQHLLLKGRIAERHAFEMFEIDRPVIGSQRRRWHPFYPFEMKRHGQQPPDVPARASSGGDVSSAKHGNG